MLKIVLGKGEFIILYIALIFFTVLLYFIYTRYIPVTGIPCIDASSTQLGYTNITVDIRDYVTSAKSDLKASVVMPVAYLKRYHHEIPTQEVHLIASDKVERNIGVRLLRHKGFKVIGYTLSDCKCRQR